MIVNITNKLVVSKRMRDLCSREYPGHPMGCPNYNKKSDCPPKCQIVYNYFNLKKKHWLIIVKFNLAKQARRMKEKYPYWTDRQCRNVLYWQGGVRKELTDLCSKFTFKKGLDKRLSFTLKPEAMGVNVFATLHHIGIPIKRNPKKTIYKVALIGVRK
jgi:predicted metal-binding protein